jgi:hypothetical protein
VIDNLLVRLRAADPVKDLPAYDEALTHRLLARATAPRPVPVARPTRRLAVTGLALASLAGAFVIGQNAATAPSASAAVAFTRDGNDYIVTVTDPESDSAHLTAALKDKGFDITMRTVPVSPSLVGALVEKDFPSGTQPLQSLHNGPCLPGDRCPIGFRVPIDFHGKTTMVFGRQARPGETYVVATSSRARGERFACQPLVGKPVPDAVRTITATGVTVTYRGIPGDTQNPTAYKARYVAEIEALSPSQVELLTQPDRHPTPLTVKVRGC